MTSERTDCWMKRSNFIAWPKDAQRDKRRAGVYVSKKDFRCLCGTIVKAGEEFWTNRTIEKTKYKCMKCRKKALDNV
jgi:predicted SprT family Zn-dependent metalloprotease